MNLHNAELTSSALAAQDLEGVQSEFQALVSGCGVYQTSSRARIKLSGEDRLRWLNGMVTNNIRDLAVNHGIYAFLLDPQGHIRGDLYAYNLGDSLLVETDQSQLAKMLETFDHYIIMDDVVVEDISSSSTSVEIAGPGSQSLLEASSMRITLEPLELRELAWQQTKLTVIRKETEKREGYEIKVPPDHAAEVLFAFAHNGGTRVGPKAMELYRIALGVPSYGQDIRERDLPQETEQARALNFNKGCYVGQEIVERIRSRGAVHRMFTGFLVEGPLPPIGTKIQVEAKDVGEITSSASLPTKEGIQNVALGYIRREVGPQSKEILAGATKLSIAKLPFQFIFG